MVTCQQRAPPAGCSGICTLIAPGDFYTTIMQDGKQIAVVHAFVNKDGKTNRWTITGMDAKGKSMEGLEIWESNSVLA